MQFEAADSVHTGGAITGFAAGVAAALSWEKSGMHNSDLVTGAMFHPAVVVAIGLTGHITPARMVSYMIFQLVGAAVGGALLLGVLGSDCHAQSFAYAGYMRTGVAPGQRVLLSVILSCLLCLVYLWCQVRLKFAPSPIVIGFAYVCLTMMSYPLLQEDSFNPLRGFGVAVSGGSAMWSSNWEHWIGAFVGGATAGLIDFVLYSPRLWGGASAKVKDDTTVTSM